MRQVINHLINEGYILSVCDSEGCIQRRTDNAREVFVAVQSVEECAVRVYDDDGRTYVGFVFVVDNEVCDYSESLDYIVQVQS